MVSYLQQELNAVERVQQFIEIESEAPDIVAEKDTPAAYWPSDHGGLVIESLSVRYAPHLPLVLDGISLSFRPREKVAIIGRTGSGKTTVTQALLRFLEADQGRILLDGVDIAKIGLTDLRSRGITVIAQEATLWSGDLRGNLVRAMLLLCMTKLTPLRIPSTTTRTPRSGTSFVVSSSLALRSRRRRAARRVAQTLSRS
jgi:ABC-type multidrug transport system fused ATPase/permease subunit